MSICPSNLIFRWTRISFCKHLSESGWNFACKKNREDKSSYPLERKIVIQKEFFQTAHFSQAFCKCKFVWGRTISQIVIHFAEREPVGLPSEQKNVLDYLCKSGHTAAIALHMPPGIRPRAASHENNFHCQITLCHSAWHTTVDYCIITRALNKG